MSWIEHCAKISECRPYGAALRDQAGDSHTSERKRCSGYGHSPTVRRIGPAECLIELVVVHDSPKA